MSSLRLRRAIESNGGNVDVMKRAVSQMFDAKLALIKDSGRNKQKDEFIKQVSLASRYSILRQDSQRGHALRKTRHEDWY